MVLSHQPAVRVSVVIDMYVPEFNLLKCSRILLLIVLRLFIMNYMVTRNERARALWSRTPRKCCLEPNIVWQRGESQRSSPQGEKSKQQCSTTWKKASPHGTQHTQPYQEASENATACTPKTDETGKHHSYTLQSTQRSA